MAATAVPKLLTVRQVAAVTGMQKWRLYQLMAEGKGPAYLRLGRTIRVSETALVQWIEEQARTNHNEGE